MGPPRISRKFTSLPERVIVEPLSVSNADVEVLVNELEKLFAAAVSVLLTFEKVTASVDDDEDDDDPDPELLEFSVVSFCASGILLATGTMGGAVELGAGGGDCGATGGARASAIC